MQLMFNSMCWDYIRLDIGWIFIEYSSHIHWVFIDAVLHTGIQCMSVCINGYNIQKIPQVLALFLGLFVGAVGIDDEMEIGLDDWILIDGLRWDRFRLK